jgi:hypothetical protein
MFLNRTSTVERITDVESEYLGKKEPLVILQT